ncbi:MAG: nitroreductase family protein [Hyphomicrobiales bacterium]
MKLLEIIKKRYSVRSYSDKPIEKEKLELILEAGRFAPSAVNKQPWRFIVITKDPFLSDIHKTYHREWFKQSKAVIVVCANHEESWKRGFDKKDHADIDTSIAIDHMILQATELNIGSCWICHFDPKVMSKTLSLPDYLEPVGMISLGYPDDEPKEKKRKNSNDIIYWEEYK